MVLPKIVSRVDLTSSLQPQPISFCSTARSSESCCRLTAVSSGTAAFPRLRFQTIASDEEKKGNTRDPVAKGPRV